MGALVGGGGGGGNGGVFVCERERERERERETVCHRLVPPLLLMYSPLSLS